MAVVAGKRKDGELKFLTTSAQLAKYTMDICGNEKCFPKRYRWCFIGKIVDAAIEVFVVAFRANKVYVEPGDMDAAMRRFNLQSESIEASYQLEALANLAYMMFGLEESRIEFWTKLINESRNKLRSWRKSVQRWTRQALHSRYDLLCSCRNQIVYHSYLGGYDAASAEHWQREQCAQCQH